MNCFNFKSTNVECNGYFSGYASVFDIEDLQSDVITRGAFQKSISRHKNHGTMPKLLWQHNANMPIGVIHDMREDEYGLFLSAELILELQTAQAAYSLLKKRAIDGLSIGYTADKVEFIDGRQTITDVSLFEISLVTFPANQKARIIEVKNNNKNTLIWTIKSLAKQLKK